MEVRAALATGAGKPLSIETVNLDGPRAGEVLIEVKATGVCHTDAFTLSGEDPEGLFPAILGHEGAGVVADVGEGVTSVAPGDHVIPLLRTGMPPVRVLPERQDQPLPVDPLDPGRGRDAGRLQPLLRSATTRSSTTWARRPSRTTRWFRNTPSPRSGRTRPSRRSATSAAGVTTGVGAVINTAKVRPGDNVVVFGLGGIGLNVVQGARLVGANMIVGYRHQPEAPVAPGEQIRHDPLRQSQGGRRRPRALSGGPHRRRRRPQLRVHRQRRDHAPGARMLPQGLGREHDHRRRRRRPGDFDPSRSSS